MNQFEYLHVALHGHYDNKLSVRFTFNGSSDPSRRWEGSLPDPDAIVRNFVSARECYVMWRNANGHYFGVITSDPLDPLAGRVMVTLMVDNGDAVAGRAVFAALSALKKAFLEDRNLTDEAVRQVLISVNFPQEPMALPSWQFDPAAIEAIPEASRRPLCYRTYLSTRELETVFSFPDQADYDRFSYVVVITATASLRQGIAVDRLTTPVKKFYSIICPQGATASKEIVAEGEHFTLTFNKEGYSPRKENITVGTPSPYIRVNGPALIAKNPDESGMGFTRRVRLSVRSAKGGMVNGYTVSVNDRPVNTMEPFIELTEVDLQPGKKVEIQVASNNYRPLKKLYEAAELKATDAIELVLTPVEQGIELRLDFGEGRIFEQQISIEKNTPEYSQLHSGNFHGFRAHRLATQGEVYHVDVRSSSKPTAPNFDNVAARNDDRNDRGRIVPRFEKATPKAEKEKIDMTMPEKAIVDKAATAKPTPAAPTSEEIHEPTVEETSGSDDNSKASAKLKLICAAICVVVVLLGAFYIIKPMFGDSYNAAPEQSELTSGTDAVAVDGQTAPAADAPTTAEAVAAPATAPTTVTPDEQADIDYLNSNRSWNRDNLKSESARKLYDAFAEGDINAIVNHPYFATEGRATNKDANNIADMIWAATGTPTQRSNEVALKKAAKKSSMNLWDLYEAVARVKPSEPNQTPRPSHK